MESSDSARTKETPSQNIPRSGVVAFVGRGEELARVHGSLQAGDRLAISAIQGMGGIGKTELAIQYAQRYWDSGDYPGGVCWLLCREVDVGTQLVGFAVGSMGMAIDTTQDLSLQVAACWRDWPAGNVLVVFDDVTDYKAIEPYLPPTEARFKVLVTTRWQLGAGVKRLDLDVLTPEAALALLAELAGPQRVDVEPEMARGVCQWLGYLPLGIELVGRYMAEKPDLTLAELRQRLEAQSITTQALTKSKTAAEMTGKLGVAAAFDLSWQEIGQTGRLPQELLYVMSVFGPAPICWAWVERAMAEVAADKLAHIRDEVLLGLHLVKRVGDGRYQLHQLVREYAQGKFAGTVAQSSRRGPLQWLDRWVRGHQVESYRRTSVCGVLVAEAQQLPQATTLRQIQAFREVVPHLQEVIANGLGWVTEDDLTWPFVGLGRFYEGQGAYGQAEPWYERCVEVVGDRLGDEHPDVALSLNNLAGLYNAQGRYSDAEPLYVEALEMRKRVLGDEHPDVAQSLNNLAGLYYSQGRYSDAEPLYVEALEMRKRLLGDEHPKVALSLNNLAGLYKAQGRYSDAEPLYVEALEMSKRLLGDEHPDVALSLNNLAALYNAQGRYSDAEPLYVEALEMWKRVLGDEHPDVALSLNNLAALYNAQGRYSDAEPLYVEALEMWKRVLGDEHPDVALSLNNLAGLYDSQGRYSDAEPLYVEALEMRKRVLGDEHPKVAVSLNNLAGLYKAQGRYSDAEPLYRSALEMRKRVLGDEHPDVAQSLNNLAALYDSQGRYSDAEPLYRSALEMSKRLLGDEHPKVALSLNNLALLYDSQGRYSDAEPLYVEALEMVTTLLGEDHPDTQTVKKNVEIFRQNKEA